MSPAAPTTAPGVRALANTMAYIAKHPNHINGAYRVSGAAMVVLNSS